MRWRRPRECLGVGPWDHLHHKHKHTHSQVTLAALTEAEDEALPSPVYATHMNSHTGKQSEESTALTELLAGRPLGAHVPSEYVP